MDIKELQVNSATNNTKNHPWEYARAKVIKQLIFKSKFLTQKEGYILDIGCGDIFFLHQFIKSAPNMKPIAIDTAFDDSIIKELSQKYHSTPCQFYKSIHQVQLEKPAKIVLLMDVIEHIEDEISFLSSLKAYNFINSETLFIITAPAFNSLYCAHDKWLGHYRRYNTKLLKSTLDEAGFKTLDYGYFFTSLLLPRLLQKGIEKLKTIEKEPNGIGGWNKGKFISKTYETILLTDFYIGLFFHKLGIKLPRLSAYTICKLK